MCTQRVVLPASKGELSVELLTFGKFMLQSLDKRGVANSSQYGSYYHNPGNNYGMNWEGGFKENTKEHCKGTETTVAKT